MSTAPRAFLTACVILAVPLTAVAQTEPILVEAESATIGTAYSVGTADGATYVTIVNDSPGFGPPTTADGALTYSVTFPTAGNYELYARFRVGPMGGSDDSFFVGNGFGDKVGTANGRWSIKSMAAATPWQRTLFATAVRRPPMFSSGSSSPGLPVPACGPCQPAI